MIHLLVVYRRSAGRLESVAPFGDRQEALEARFAAEDAHRGDDDLEIVVLSGASWEGVRRTHARYFVDAEELLADLLDTLDREIARLRR